MAQTWQWAWALVAFGAELAALGALAWWGATTGGTTALRWVLAIGLPLAVAAAWGLFAAPQAVVQVLVLAVLTKVVVFGAAVLALLGAGAPRLAAVLAVAAVLGTVLSGPLTAQQPPDPVSAPAVR
ncbi:DUF2568 domain-containing protein [Geodermatophilus marinus]|uniref:DUF2568 domain-containing protein n=1 Tax=Geodermatophilus sp. LHW52908 TaxID=2303986 RepID=UPI0013144149|nr:DUF2568 domain-containing protein [Geodermatophilus sp. LHW52908]